MQQLEQDLPFQRREWRAQRVGWLLMAAVVAAALFGGAGPLTTTTAEAGSLHVEYRRFDRFKAPTPLRFRVGGRATSGTGPDTLRLWIDRDYLGRFQVGGVLPTPDGVEVGPDRLTYSFVVSNAVGPAEATGPVEVTFHLTAEAFGVARGRAGLPGGEAVAFDQLIYP